MKKSFRKVILSKVVATAVFALVVGLTFMGQSVFADDVIYEGDGDAAAGTAAECNNYIHGYRKLCGSSANGVKDGSGGGGASWHIYSTNYTTTLGYYSGIMKGGYTMDTIKSNCKKSDGWEWYAAYGWDGRDGTGRGYNSGYLHYAPIRWDSKLSTGPLIYNSYGALSLSQLSSAGNLEGKKITAEAAKELYRQYTKLDTGTAKELDNNGQIGYFCVRDLGAEYFSQSNASAANGYSTTNIAKGGVSVDAPEVNIEVGGSTPIVFSHDVFSSASTTSGNGKWEIHKKVYKNNSYVGTEGLWGGTSYGWGNGVDYEIASSWTGSIQSDSGSGKTTVTTKENATSGTATNFTETRQDQNGITRYIASPRSYDSHIARDVLAKVTFKKEGSYKFCEYIMVNGAKSTEACVVVNVGPKSGYASKSNVSNGGKAESTGIATEGTARTDDAKIKENGKVSITFSHNIYSTVQKLTTDAKYYIKRTVNGNGGISGSFSVSTPSSYPYSSNSTSDTTGTIGITQFKTLSDGYYIADVRNYTDGKYNYILRDQYDVTFPNKGSYDFCETVVVVFGANGSGEIVEQELTSACSTVIVGDKDMPPPVVSKCERTDWTPSSYLSSNSSSGQTSVIAATMNSSVPAFSKDWVRSSQSVIYAKPNDVIKWLHCYYPGVQKVANTDATYSHAAHSSSSDTTNSNKQMREWGGWSNYFRVTNTNLKFAPLNTYYGVFPIGNSDIQQWEDTYTVESKGRSRAGLLLKETNTSSDPSSAWVGGDKNCSWKCRCVTCNCTTSCNDSGSCTTKCSTCCDTCYHTNPYWPNGRTGAVSDTATVHVPYNFVNSSGISIKNDVVYAGETVTIRDAWFSVSPTWNGTTNGTYATKVDNAEIKIVSYASTTDKTGVEHRNVGSDLCGVIRGSVNNVSNCDTIADRVRNLNDPEYYQSGHTDHDFSESNDGNSVQNISKYNVYDVPAGYYYCVVAAVYPADSGSETNMNASGNGLWYMSEPSCVQVAKKPTMQVWGNSVYTEGEIVTSSMPKRVVSGFYEFNSGYYAGQAVSATNTTIFGSWTEHSILSPTSKIFGFASGASTGAYTSDPAKFSKRSKSPGLGGSWEGGGLTGVSKEDFCIRSPLTIPNSDCKQFNTAGGNSSVTASTPSDKAALIARFVNGEAPGVEVRSASSLGATTVPVGQTLVYVNNGGDFNINGDITYEDNYTTLNEIPKLIIYAENINIDCNVGRVDAVLIAENQINTCPKIDPSSGVEYSGAEGRAASTQLKIFGSVITHQFKLNRIYGAGAGASSTEPAEIVDYDTSLYLWGAKKAETSSSGKIDITYQQELPPRY